MVFELLVADQPARADRARSGLEVLALGRHGRRQRPAASRPAEHPPQRPQPSGDGGQSRRLHPLQSLRPRLPRGPGQRRDRHGRPRPSREDRLRLRRPDGRQHLRRLRRMRAGLPDRRADAGDAARRAARPAPSGPTARSTASAPTAASAASSPTTSRTTRSSTSSGKDGPANHERLCVKGRFGFDYVHHPDRLTEPLIRKDGVPKSADDEIDPANPWTHFREATWDEALERAAAGLLEIRDRKGGRRAGRLRLGQGLERGGLSLPEAGAHRLRHQQRRSLHAALPRLVGGGPDGGHRLGRGDGAVLGGARRRGHHRHRRQPDQQPSGRRDLHQERGQARRQADRHRSARPGPVAPRHRSTCGSSRAPTWRC